MTTVDIERTHEVLDRFEAWAVAHEPIPPAVVRTVDGQLCINGIAVHACCFENADGPHGDCDTAEVPSETADRGRWPDIQFDMRSGSDGT